MEFEKFEEVYQVLEAQKEKDETAAEHGEVGRTVQSQEKHARIKQGRKSGKRYKPAHIFYSQRFEPFRTA